MPGDILFLWLLKPLVTDQFKVGSMNYNKDKLKLVFMFSIQLEEKNQIIEHTGQHSTLELHPQP